MTADDKTHDLYALIGYPVSHSFSPLIHNTAFARLGINARYVTLPVAPEELGNFISRLPELGLHGFNVTVPHKETIINYLDEIDEFAQAAGAVNTVQLRGGRWIGYNTDVAGFAGSLDSAGPRTDGGVIILGAGGSARAVVVALRQFNFEAVAIVNRTSTRAQEMLVRLKDPHIVASTLDRIDFPIRLVVNCTTVGLRGEPLHLTSKIWAQRPLVMDLIYHAPTPLLQDAHRRGCQVVDGLDMLVRQAASSFRIWTGQPIPMKTIRDVLIKK